MKKYPGYVYRLFNTKRYEATSPEAITDVVRDFKPPVQLPTIYKCLKTHHMSMAHRPPVRVNKKGEVIVDKRFNITEDVLDAPLGMYQNYELGLEEFIKAGRDLLAQGQMQITAQNFVSAIKVKADIEKSNKDRKMDILKSMFSGAAPQNAMSHNVGTDEAS